MAGEVAEFALCVNYRLLRHLAEEDVYCEVRPSRIKEAGLGLFSKTAIPPNTIVCRYQGTVLRTKEAMRLEDKSYLMRLGEQCYVDAKDDYTKFARFINDCRNPNLYNVSFLKSPSDQCAYVITSRELQPGEELFVDYGRWYWIGKTPKKLISMK